MTTLIIIYGTLIAFFAKVLYNARQDEKRLEAIYGNVYSAKKPTKKEIEERNHIDWLLMPEEFDNGNPILELHEHEKALA